MNSPNPRQNHSLKRSYPVGIFGVLMTGLTQDYLIPLLLLLGGTVRQVALLNSLMHIVPALAQLSSADLSRRSQSRKTVIGLNILLQSLTLTAIAVLIWNQQKSPVLYIALMVLYTSFGALVNPCWVSLLSDLVPANQRGHYFGWRARNLGIIALLAALAGGGILAGMERFNAYHGFSLIFGLAAISRLISWMYLRSIAEPPLHFKAQDCFSLWTFLSRGRQSNFLQFTFFIAAMNFCVNLAAPYFAVFMLRDLQFSYVTFSMINIVAPLVLYTTIRRWGRHADQIGNLKVIQTVAPLFGFIPFIWIIHQHLAVLLVAEALSGFLWAGFNLCTSNFIIDAVSSEKRTRCLAYFTLINGAALALGALCGGFLLRYLPPLDGHRILSLFLVSGILRIAVGWFFSRNLKEVRPVQDVRRHSLLFSMIGVKPISGIDHKVLQI